MALNPCERSCASANKLKLIKFDKEGSELAVWGVEILWLSSIFLDQIQGTQKLNTMISLNTEPLLIYNGSYSTDEIK